MKKIFFDQELNKQNFPSFVEIFYKNLKSNRGLFFCVYIASSRHSGSWKNS